MLKIREPYPSKPLDFLEHMSQPLASLVINATPYMGLKGTWKHIFTDMEVWA